MQTFLICFGEGGQDFLYTSCQLLDSMNDAYIHTMDPVPPKNISHNSNHKSYFLLKHYGQNLDDRPHMTLNINQVRFLPLIG